MCYHFDETECEDWYERVFYHTQISYQSLILKELLANFQGSTAIFLDCAFAGLGVLKGKQSLLAACSSNQAAANGALSLTANVLNISREAAAKEQWVSWGGLHGNILLKSLTPYTIANMPIWQENTHKRDQDVSIMLRPMPKTRNDDREPPGSSIARASYQEWNNSLPVCSVIFAANVAFWNDGLTAMFNKRMLLRPAHDTDASQAPVKVGMVTNVLREQYSAWVQCRIDARFFHELVDHQAFTFVSGPHEPMAWLEDEEDDKDGVEGKDEYKDENEEWEMLEK